MSLPEPSSSSPRRRLLESLLPPNSTAMALSITIAIQSIGLGLLIASNAIYFTRYVGLSISQVGMGLTATSACSLIIGVPIGHLADRRGPRGLLIALLSMEACVVLAYRCVDSYLSFLLIVGMYQVLDRAGGAVRGGLIARVVAKEMQVRSRAYFRSVGNVGFAIGASLAGAGLQFNTATSFHVLFLIAAIGYFGAALALTRLPAVPAIPRHQGLGILAAVSDRPFVAFVVLNGVMAFHYAILEVGMPLWVVKHTAAPTWMVSALFVLNTVMVIVLQVAISRRAETVAASLRAVIWAGALLAVACALMGLAGSVCMLLAIVVLLTAGVLHALAEMHQAAAAWSLADEMAPPNAHGQYQGLFTVTSSTGVAIGASVVTLLAVNGGAPGWIALGLLFLGASYGLSLVARRVSVSRWPAPSESASS